MSEIMQWQGAHARPQCTFCKCNHWIHHPVPTSGGPASEASYAAPCQCAGMHSHPYNVNPTDPLTIKRKSKK